MSYSRVGMPATLNLAAAVTSTTREAAPPAMLSPPKKAVAHGPQQ
jgi:hypothetical protein